MKILFIERQVEYIDPMHVELLSALAKRDGHSTFLSVEIQDDIELDIGRIKPDLVVLGGTKTGGHKDSLKIARRVKKVSKELPIIMGGPHTTFYPEIIEDENIDAVCAGEGDDAWPEFIKALECGNGAINNVRNIFTKENWLGKWKHASFEERRHHLGNRITNLDDLPHFDRELVYRNTHLLDFPFRSFMSSRGCPFQCTYCFEPKFNQIYRGKGPIHNRYSVRRLCSELKEMKERYQSQFIKFHDDLFWFKKEIDPWLEEFAEVYPKEVGLPFFCLTRCNILTEEHLKLLKPAGLHSMTMSIEAGNEYIRNEVIKRRMTREQILNAFRLCNKYDIKTFANSILAIPVRSDIMKEQHKTALDYDIESLDINIESKVVFGEFTIAYPYPGCELSEYAESNQWFSQKEDFDKLHHSYQNKSPMRCFTKEEKMMQANLSLLGTPCLALPWLRNLVVHVLIKLPLARLYYLFYFLAKGYLNVFKIYPLRLSMRTMLSNIVRSYKVEKEKHLPSEELYSASSAN